MVISNDLEDDLSRRWILFQIRTLAQSTDFFTHMFGATHPGHADETGIGFFSCLIISRIQRIELFLDRRVFPLSRLESVVSTYFIDPESEPKEFLHDKKEINTEENHCCAQKISVFEILVRHIIDLRRRERKIITCFITMSYMRNQMKDDRSQHDATGKGIET